MDCTTRGTNGENALGSDEVISLYEALHQVPDYRHKRGRRYEAATILVILLLAKLAGERTVSGAAHWAQLRAAWLTKVLGLKRLPCANTYHYVCAHLDVTELNTVVRESKIAATGAVMPPWAKMLVPFDHPLVATILAVLNSIILALFDQHNVKNARNAIRTYAAFPQRALDLLIFPP